MAISLRLFAAARDIAGCEYLELPLDFPVTADRLRLQLAQTLPALSPLLPLARFAVDLRYVEDHATIETAKEIVLILPVSGG